MAYKSTTAAQSGVWTFQALLKELVDNNSRQGVDKRSERDRWRKRISHAMQTGRLHTITPSRSLADARFDAQEVELWVYHQKNVKLRQRRTTSISNVIGSTGGISDTLSSTTTPAPERLAEAYRKLAEEKERLTSVIEQMRPVYDTELERRAKISAKQKRRQ